MEEPRSVFDRLMQAAERKNERKRVERSSSWSDYVIDLSMRTMLELGSEVMRHDS